MSKTYLVSIPFAGHFTVEVEAADEDEAIDTALGMEWLTEPLKLADGVECESIETHRDIVRGNVCYVSQAHADAEEI